jgi:hypothetical protein
MAWLDREISMSDGTRDEVAVMDWISEGNPNCVELASWHQEPEKLPGLNQEAESGSGIYSILAQHQVTGEWRHRDLAVELHRWAVIFNTEFKLGVSEVALRVDWLSARRLGHFRSGFNGFGLKGEIAVNERYLARREPWQVLGTLLHELLHAWQQEHGKPGKPPYHNKEFRDKALQYGLVIDEDGVTQYLAASAFKNLLTSYGVQMPEQLVPSPRRKGESKLKKWSCGCGVNVRVAIADFQARCLKCDGLFVHAE